MRHFSLLIFFITLTLGVFAQSADGRYASRMTQDGMLYFIMPHKIKALSGVRKFDYDMTLLTWTDSVTVNFTFESPMMFVPDDLCIVSGTDTVMCDSYSPLYIDIKKKGYEIRITSKYGVADITRVIESPCPPVFSFNQGKEHRSASYTPGAWRKDRAKLIDILKLYQYSK